MSRDTVREGASRDQRGEGGGFEKGKSKKTRVGEHVSGKELKLTRTSEEEGDVLKEKREKEKEHQNPPEGSLENNF